MTREFFRKVMECGKLETDNHVYKVEVTGSFKKIIREDGYVCAVYIR